MLLKKQTNTLLKLKPKLVSNAITSLKSKAFFILLGILVIISGLIGPAAIKLNLFELSKVLAPPGSKFIDFYFWIGLVFVLISALILIVLILRRDALISSLAVLGTLVWSISVGFFHYWHSSELTRLTELEKLRGIELSSNFGYKMYSLYIKTLSLEWGVYLILSGFLLVLIVVIISKKIKS